MMQRLRVSAGTGLKMGSIATQKTVSVPPSLMSQSSLSLARHLGASLKLQVGFIGRRRQQEQQQQQQQ